MRCMLPRLPALAAVHYIMKAFHTNAATFQQALISEWREGNVTQIYRVNKELHTHTCAGDGCRWRERCPGSYDAST
jgi:hypothetical protein